MESNVVPAKPAVAVSASPDSAAEIVATAVTEDASPLAPASAADTAPTVPTVLASRRGVTPLPAISFAPGDAAVLQEQPVVTGAIAGIGDVQGRCRSRPDEGVGAGFGGGRRLAGSGLCRPWGRVGVVGVGGPCLFEEGRRGGRLDRAWDGRGWAVVMRPWFSWRGVGRLWF